MTNTRTGHRWVMTMTDSALILNPRIKFTVRRRDGYGAVTDYNALVNDEWVGIVFPCAMHRTCQCDKWHGYVSAIGKGVSMPGHPQINITGFSTRADAARALKGIRTAWDLIRPFIPEEKDNA